MMRYPRAISFICAYLALLLQSYLNASKKTDFSRTEEFGSLLANVVRDFSYIEGSAGGSNSHENFHENWTLCKYGMQQSPIDVNNLNVKLKQSIGSLMTNYHHSNAIMKNRGYYTMVEWPNGAGSLGIDGKNYILQQCHWHSPSEHTLNGDRSHPPMYRGKNYSSGQALDLYPLELHMVHQSSDNKIAVIGIIYMTGQPDPFLSKLMSHLSRPVDLWQSEEPLGLVLPPIIVKDAQYYRYQGSLTTPPCTEGVTWILIQEIKTISQEQLDLLRAAVQWNDNARPVQPLNERIISLYKPRDDESTQDPSVLEKYHPSAHS